MFYTGGMPSSHTSLVTTLTLSIGAAEGTSSILFAIALIFSLYFVFEATGLRQEVGQQARVLNDMFDELYQTHHVDRRRLKELVGHTWQEVLGGGLVGVFVFWLARRWILPV
jgi:acid phosphatase family membrane protein YuiD